AGDRESLALQRVGRVPDRVVLDRAHDHVAPLQGKGPRAAHHPDVVGFGSAAREDDLRGRCVQERRDLGPGVLDRPLRLLAEGVDARRVPEMLAEIRKHRLEDLGANRGAGVMVEVDAGHGPEPSRDHAQANKAKGPSATALGPGAALRPYYLPPCGSFPPSLWGGVCVSGLALSPASPVAGLAVSSEGVVAAGLVSPAFMSMPSPAPTPAFTPARRVAGFDASVFFAAATLALYAALGVIFTDLIVVHSSGLLFSFGIPGFGPVEELAILSSTSMPA